MAGLLIAGYQAPGSGLRNVLAGLAEGLGAAREVHLAGFVPGERGSREAELAGRPIHLLGTPQRHFRADPAHLERLLDRHRPGHVLIVGPAFMAAPVLHQLKRFRESASLSLYLPVEGTLVGETLADTLRLVDGCFLYTDSAHAGVAALCGRAGRQDRAFRAPLLATVGHGFDAARFHRVAGDERIRRRSARLRAFPGRPDLADAFIVLNANRLSHRKRLDLTLAGFALFASDKPDACLCLHTGLRSAEQDDEIRKDIAATGLGGRIILSPQPRDVVLPPDQLNLLYNACDVGLSTSGGEGWGLGIFEHAATGAALVLPDHTSFAENWNGAAHFMPIERDEFVFYESAMIHLVAPASVATALEAVYRDPAYRRALAQRARRRATSRRLRWRHVAARVSKALASVEARRSTL